MSLYLIYTIGVRFIQKNIKSIMENVIETEVPLKVDIGHGKNWLEAH